MRRIVIVVLALAATSACADSPPATTPGRSVSTAPPAAAAAAAAAPQQACDLLTPDRIADVLGQIVERGEQVGFECNFRKPATPQGLRHLAVRLRLEISDGSPDVVMDRFKTAMREGLRGPYEPESVIGVGDVAAWDGDTLAAGKSIANGSKSAFLLVQLSDVDAADEQRLAREIMNEALSKVRG